MNANQELVSSTDDFDDLSDVQVEVINSNKLPVATPRTYRTTEEYVPSKDRSYYRNDGNKHIKSRGL